MFMDAPFSTSDTRVPVSAATQSALGGWFVLIYFQFRSVNAGSILELSDGGLSVLQTIRPFIDSVTLMTHSTSRFTKLLIASVISAA
jgi:hypothetical protein